MIIKRLAAALCAAMVMATAVFSSAAVHAVRTVRVGYYQLDNYQEYDAATGQYRGYSYDYMQALAQYADWEYEFVPLDSVEQGVAMLEEGRIDLLNNVEKTTDRQGKLYFSTLPSGERYTSLLVKSDDTTTAFEDFDSLEKLTVGLDYQNTLNSGFVDYCKDNDCMPRLIYFHTAQQVSQALDEGIIDACIASSLSDVDMRVVAKFGTTSSYFAVTKGNSDLLGELNRAMNALKTNDPYFEEKLFAKYHTKSFDQPTVLSSDEKQYIATDPLVRVVYDPSWYPVSYRDDKGVFAGAMADLFAMITQKTGLRFTFVDSGSYEASMGSFDAGQADVVAGFPYDYTWAAQHGADLTAPFIAMTVFTAYRPASDGAAAVIAVPAGSYARYYCEHILQLSATYVDGGTTEGCLKDLLAGRATMAMVDSYQLEYYQERAAYRGLSFKADPNADYRLSIATSKASDGRIYSIISKTLSSLGSENISTIFRQTAMKASSRSLIDVIYANPQVAGWLFTVIGFLLAAMVSVIIYTRVSKKRNEKLAAAVNARSEFMSNISHDMRTPLNGIIGFTDLALGSDKPEQVKDYLGKVKTSSELMLNLVNDTLDISKIESGKYVLAPQDADADTLVRGVVVPIQAAADAKGITFVVDVARMYRGTVHLDVLSVQKIFMNLLSNAVKFTPAGGTVWATVEDIPAASDGCNCHIMIKDSGIGISPDFLPRIYEPFTQEQAPEAHNAMGTGLGLSIVKSMVDMMKGRIEVHSVKGQGTCFDVYLPISRLAMAVPKKAAVPTAVPMLSGRKVLLCEDNQLNTEIAAMMLRGAGLSVVAVADGRQGLTAFSASAPGEFAAIMMDLRMPIMDGYETAQAIRALDRPDARTVPIIAMSADTYPEDIRRCMAAGMDAHVAKPLDRDRLVAELGRLCGGEVRHEA